jgi:C1A family cysteine protease
LAAHNSIKKFGFFVPLSIQQVIDCSANDLTYGCRGGYLEGAYTYIQMNGVVLESSYPYTYMNTSIAGSCKSKGGPFKLSSFTPIQGGNCNALIDELAHGPISVGVSGYNLQYYGEGVFNECSNDLDHAVMVVGYRSGVGWRIKNSWGADWGEEGYGWIAEGNTCGICDMAVSIKL